MDYLAEYERWLASDALTAEERAELESIRGNDEAIKDRFFAPLSFGTAGLRGVLGTGLYRMNRFTVGAATQGLANLILQNGEAAMKRGVSIAYDSRHMSPEFAQLAASILSANGIAYTVRTENLQGSSAFGGRSRGRSGSFGIDPNYSYEYHIYVHKSDYENALRLIR